MTEHRDLKALGERLRKERLKRNECQAKFAARVGVSVPTLAKMEAGAATVTIGHWLSALEILDRTRDLGAVLAEPVDLFAKIDEEQGSRKRASRRPR